MGAYERSGTQVVIHGQFARVAEALLPKPDMRLLDLGCGVGLFLAWLAQQVPGKYYGIDLSLNSLNNARKLNRALELTVGDAESLPYKDESFDRISCNGAAHHLLDLRSALREMYRVLAPGGILVLHEPAATALTSAVRMLLLRSNEYESPADLAVKEEFTRTRLQALLVEVGFTGISTSLHDFLAYPLSGNYLKLPLSQSKLLMGFLWQLESRLERWSILKPIFDLFAWRLLVIATKPKARVQTRAKCLD